MKIRGNSPQTGSLPDLFQKKGPQFGWLVHAAVIESCRHGPVHFVHKAHNVCVRAFPHILRSDVHAVSQEGGLGADIGDAVNFHATVAAFAIHAVKSARAMILEASPEYPDIIGIKCGGNCVAFHSLTGTSDIIKGKFFRRVDSQRRQSV